MKIYKTVVPKRKIVALLEKFPEGDVEVNFVVHGDPQSEPSVSGPAMIFVAK